MLYAASTSHRRNLILEPFPPMYQNLGGYKNYNGLQKVLDEMPSVDEMLKYTKKGEDELKKFLGNERYELLKWTLTCGRCALLKMPDKKRIEVMKTEHQYMMLVDNPEHAAQFKKWRNQYGSVSNHF